MSTRESYSADEDTFIRANYRSMPYRDIGMRLGRSTTAIAHRVSKLNLRKVALRRWTTEEDDAIRARCQSDSLVAVSESLGRHRSEVSERARQLGVTFRKPKRELTKGGHVIIAFSPTGCPILEHRVVMERHMERSLVGSELVHHINEDKLDNGIGNLFLCASASEHQRAHRSLDRLVPELLGRGIIRFNRDKGIYELCETSS